MIIFISWSLISRHKFSLWGSAWIPFTSIQTIFSFLSFFMYNTHRKKQSMHVSHGPLYRKHTLTSLENRFLPHHITKHQQQEIFFVRSCAFSFCFFIIFSSSSLYLFYLLFFSHSLTHSVFISFSSQIHRLEWLGMYVIGLTGYHSQLLSSYEVFHLLFEVLVFKGND